jgi:gluconolactonase
MVPPAWLGLTVLAIACDPVRATPEATPDLASPDASPPLAGPLIGMGGVEVVGTGFTFTEGPQWRSVEQDLVFSDIPANTIFRYVAGSAPIALRTPSGNANGLAIDGAGALLAAEHGSRSVTRNGAVVVDRFEGKRLNSPNDLITAPDGTIYFTDPPYGIKEGQVELDFMGVFRVAPSGALTAEHRGARTERPNGIGMSPARDVVYVADSADGGLYRHAVIPGGALAPRTKLAQTAGGADGLAIDAEGNVYVTSKAGVEVFAPDGKKWGTIPLAERPTNCAFGDADLRTLYITARTSVFRVRLAGAGLSDR